MIISAIKKGLLNGYLSPVVFLWGLIDASTQRQILSENNYEVFHRALELENIDTFNFIITKAIELGCAKDMILSREGQIISTAMFLKPKKFIDLLFDKADHECFKEMIVLQSYEAIRWYAGSSSPDLELLYKKAVQHNCVKEMLTAQRSPHSRWRFEYKTEMAASSFYYEKAAQHGYLAETLAANNYELFVYSPTDLRPSLYQIAVDNHYATQMLFTVGPKIFSRICQQACSENEIEALQFLWDKAIEHGCAKELLSDNNYQNFQGNDLTPNLALLDFLYQKATEIGCEKDMLSSNHYAVFYSIPRDMQHTEDFDIPKMLNYPLESDRMRENQQIIENMQFMYDKALAQDCAKEMLMANNCRMFSSLFLRRFEHISFFWDKAVEQGCAKEILLASGRDLFYCISSTSTEYSTRTLRQRRLEQLEFLWDKAVEQDCAKELLSYRDYSHIKKASFHLKDLSMFLFLYQKAIDIDCEKELVCANNYGLFYAQGPESSLSIMAFVYNKMASHGSQKEMLAANNYKIFYDAACGPSEEKTLEFLWEKAREHGCEKEMLSANNYAAYIHASPSNMSFFKRISHLMDDIQLLDKRREHEQRRKQQALEEYERKSAYLFKQVNDSFNRQSERVAYWP